VTLPSNAATSQNWLSSTGPANDALKPTADDAECGCSLGSLPPSGMTRLQLAWALRL